MSDMDDTPKRKERRTPRPVTAERLRRAALRHLDRYATTEARLRQGLERRIARSSRLHGSDEHEAQGWIRTIIADLRTLGLLDDRGWAERRARQLAARGFARTRIEQNLRAAGISADHTALAIETLKATGTDERDAAWAFARRRRIGPFRADADRAEHRTRDLARMGRGGFSYEMARRVIDAEEPEQ